MAKQSTLTKERLARILTARLSLKDPAFHLEKAGGRLVGDVVSPSFRGRRDHERQQMIWDALDAELGSESVTRVGMLLAYTPEEWELGARQPPATKAAKRAG